MERSSWGAGGGAGVQLSACVLLFGVDAAVISPWKTTPENCRSTQQTLIARFSFLLGDPRPCGPFCSFANWGFRVALEAKLRHHRGGGAGWPLVG